MTRRLPICVDLDGTLIHDDVTILALNGFVRGAWSRVFQVVAWFLRGRAYLKRQLALRVPLDPSRLRYNNAFLSYIKNKRESGHRIFLVTACNIDYANVVASYLGIFDGVLASDEVTNLRAEKKAQALVAQFGNSGFIYAGNSKDDVAVWKYSAENVLVTPTNAALKAMQGEQYTLFS